MAPGSERILPGRGHGMAEASEQEILELGERASRFLWVVARADADVVRARNEWTNARIDAAVAYAETVCAKARVVGVAL